MVDLSRNVALWGRAVFGPAVFRLVVLGADGPVSDWRPRCQEVEDIEEKGETGKGKRLQLVGVM